MSIMVRFTPESMTVQQYRQIAGEVVQSFPWPPEGLDCHVCLGTDGDLSVNEIWQSQEQYEAFQKKVKQVLEANELEWPEPEIIPIHNCLMPAATVRQRP